MSKPKVMLVSDVPGWAFDQNMHDLAEYLPGFDFTHLYMTDWLLGKQPSYAQWMEYDAIFECYHRNPPMGIPMDRAIGALRSEWFKPEHPAPPDADDIALVNRYAAFQVAVKRNLDELISQCPNVEYLTNPINMRRFPRATPLRSQIIAEWNGNAGHKSIDGRYIKHLRDIVIPSCQKAGVELHVAEYTTPHGAWRKRALAEMPEFYQQANVALCASEYEAASFSVMEAMASGLAVIATDVGNHREMRDAQLERFGDTGIVLVDRSVDAFAAALQALTPQRAREMGAVNREEIDARWSWDAWASRYEAFFRRVTDKRKKLTARQVVGVPMRLPEKPAVPAPAPVIPVDFSFWNKVDPENFLTDDWDNPSRKWAGDRVALAVQRGACSLVEAGPGVGIDYERQFRQAVLDGKLSYTGFEGSSSFCARLKKKFPESAWENKTITDLPAGVTEIVYTKAVLEHQPALEPSLSRFLGAATKFAILIWYRPPASREVGTVEDGVHYRTYCKADVLNVVARSGWRIVEEAAFDSGNVGWFLERV